MAEPKVTEVQEHVIEVDGIRYHLVNVKHLYRPPHMSVCFHCDGHAPAPADDPDRLRLFDHWCRPGYSWNGQEPPLLCDSRDGWVYKRMAADGQAAPGGGA